MIHLQSFCGDSVFWNTTLLVDGSWPQLTDCFVNTVVIWLPCMCLWLPLPFYLYWLAQKTDVTPLHVTCLNSAKTFFSAMLSLIAVVILIQDCSGVSFGNVLPVAVYVADGLRVISYFCTALLSQHERRYGMFTSAVQCTFWWVLVVCDVVPFYTIIMKEVYTHDLLRFVMFTISYCLEVILVALFCISEADDDCRGNYQSLDKRKCPEVTASFPSQILFAWMTRYVYQGWRKDLEESELFSLNPRDTSKTLIPPFEREWELEKERFRVKQLAKEKKNGFISLKDRIKSSMPRTENYSDPLYPNHVTETTSLIGSSPLTSSFQLMSHLRVHRKYGAAENPKSEKEKEKPTPSLMRVLTKLIGPWLVVGLIQKVLSDCFLVLSPVLLGLLIDFASSGNVSARWQGYALAALMFLVQMIKSLLFNFSFWSSQVAGMQAKTILIAAIYKKALTMNSEARRVSTAGEIVNLMSVDCQRIQDVMNIFFFAWTTPLQVVLAVIVLYMYIGASVFAGVVTLLLLVPLNSYIAGRQQKLNLKNLKFKDQRLRLTNEVLNGMKVLKLYAWEPSFDAKISEIRDGETSVLLKIGYLNILMGICWNIAPFLVTLATFVTFVQSSPDNHLDARRAFVTLALFNMLRVPLGLLSTIISLTVQAIVSVQRMNNFLCCEDLNQDNVKYDSNAEDAVTVRNGVFTWDKSYEPTLMNIDLTIPEGKLVAVVGHVGCGKSTLISSLLGETEKISGEINIKSSVAYVPQQAWIQNATLRDNILFGKPYEEKRYQQVLRACALERDLEILSAGDMTEIGEKGINLSGGQKQRVSLARAVYSENDIYFFDDPLSAVDSHVGKHIFNKVIGPTGLLKGKTRILVTHGVHWLPLVDEIIVMTDGCISETGSYERLMSHNGPFAQFLQIYLQQTEDSDDDTIDPEITKLIEKIRDDVETATSDAGTSGDELARLIKERRRKYSHTRSQSLTESQKLKASSTLQMLLADEENEKGRLVQDETMEKGKVKRTVFFTYIRSAGTIPFLASILFFLLFQATSAASNFWLSQWTDDPLLANALANSSLSETYRNKNDYYLTVFGVLGIAQLLTLIFNNTLFWVRIVVASRILHRKLLTCILRSPMSFFDTTPIGRMMNRFSRDVETIDNNLPVIIRDFLSTGTMAIVTLVVISISTPLFISLVVPILILYYCIQGFYIPTSRQLKRIESVTRSPIYVHFSETISGGSTIRAYRASERFLEESRNRVDRNQSFYFASLVANRWLGMNLEIIANIVIFGAAIFSVVTPGISGGTVGLSVSYAMQISSCLTWMVRQMSDLETNIVSVERVKEYSELEPEAPWVNPHRRPVPSWPSNGRVIFNNYCTRYRPGLDLVLRGVTFTIEPGQKIGIVGRTGAGKSSLTLCLFRLIESAGGSIMIDGVNIADIGLHDLRSKITILPQDPVLFSGTLRMNLDPLDQYTDEQIWKALDRAHLKHFVEDLPERLHYQVGEEGQSLSVGQRQLVCLARTLLRKTKLLVLDEATAAVDMETDTLIQNTIRTAFSSCTIITIAHRLNTVMDYDRILVLDSGVVKEFDAPHALLGDKKSVFYSMAKDADLV